ncbi:hypothetical protein BJ875DRAFT_477749 [Amylocarpus encephaloides]|uniref:Uncharacterized protein n=1 Tax=Amylocarpus encephaloides TaxID=45428 RepID=A0A9P7Y742_9HELO|nr:hypothetical protein BJ875DRAFT_477749 [Amylocarpus encephaloides]
MENRGTEFNQVSLRCSKTSDKLPRYKMDVFYSYTYGTAGWLTLQALPLIVSPTIIITLLSPEVRDPTGL